ncbi:hypothetical protein, conserved [Trypanosoma brucei gambiense DAL972]|uniref:Uncharacterized protein n=2 Tax=Trypanosoma brucei TaxID=5691 RepID=C9ZTN7_TRYB9|nr:hypothetical protein, conserved [Trypanosoma brucei gambiense DAL972]CBH12772.1 hypothetical protein, conserved [Trypanosoma brucei gambiense DAL972]|eukprot:XP_011775052.1 hypothetical protein, conserved [Trypanosoma brucei gambiense DAL972]
MRQLHRGIKFPSLSSKLAGERREWGWGYSLTCVIQTVNSRSDNNIEASRPIMVRTLRSVTTHRHPTVRAPASLLYNNLSFVEEHSLLVYTSRRDCVIVNTETNQAHLLPIGSMENEMILQCSAIHAPGAEDGMEPQVLILITMHKTTQLWTANKPISLVSHGGVHGEGSCGGLAASAGGGAHVIMGTSKGVVMFAEYCGGAAPMKDEADQDAATSSSIFRVASAVKGHKERAVTAAQISRFPDSELLAVSGDAAGQLLLWSRDQQPLVSISTLECVTAVQIVSGGDFVVAASGAGRLLVLDSHTGSTCIDVCAHSRWIHNLSFNAACNMILSAAEDGYVTVWALPSDKKQSIVDFRPAVMHHTPHSLPTGAAISADGSTVFVTIYDVDGVNQYTVTADRE